MVKVPDFQDGAARDKVTKKIRSLLIPAGAETNTDVTVIVHCERMAKLIALVDCLLENPDRIDHTTSVATNP